jgi:hypothetical protein
VIALENKVIAEQFNGIALQDDDRVGEKIGENAGQSLD